MEFVDSLRDLYEVKWAYYYTDDTLDNGRKGFTAHLL